MGLKLSQMKRYKIDIPEYLPERDKEIIRRACGLGPDDAFHAESCITMEGRDMVEKIERDKWYERKVMEDLRG